MKTEVKKLPRGQAELIIEVTVEEYQPFLDQAVKIISEQIKIPGFRPGKAGFEIVKQKVGENEIWQQALEPAIRKTFLKAVDENKMLTVGSPEVDVVKLAPGNNVIYKATVNLFPKVDVADYSKLKVAKKSVEVKPAEVKKTLENIAKMRAKESLVDRAAKSGDKVEIDFEVFMDKIPVENGKSQNFALVIGENTFIPGFEEQIIGLAKGETKDFQLKFPKNYHQKFLADKLADFKVKVNSVFNLELPKLDDEFAKSLGDFKTIKEVEEKILENLQAEQAEKEMTRQEEEILDQIIEASKFEDIPDLLVNSEAKKMLEELEHNLGHQGLAFADYLQHLKKTKEELLLDFAPQAIKRVKSALLIKEIKAEEKIEASDKEIEQELGKIRETYGGGKEIEDMISQPAYRDYLSNIIAAKKVIDHLRSVMIG
ncbi:MAG: trigger factor [Candidatus Buchananbacteria bacterium]